MCLRCFSKYAPYSDPAEFVKIDVVEQVSLAKHKIKRTSQAQARVGGILRTSENPPQQKSSLPSSQPPASASSISISPFNFITIPCQDANPCQEGNPPSPCKCTPNAVASAVPPTSIASPSPKQSDPKPMRSPRPSNPSLLPPRCVSWLLWRIIT